MRLTPPGFPEPVLSWGGKLQKMGHTFSGLAGPEEASYGREGAASMSLQAVGRLVVEEGAQAIHGRGDADSMALQSRALPA